MTLEELALKQQQTEDRSQRNEGRIKKLEEKYDILSDLVTSVAVMAEQLKALNVNVGSLKTEVEEIKEKPAKRWDAIVAAILSAAVAGFIGFISRGLL